MSAARLPVLPGIETQCDTRETTHTEIHSETTLTEVCSPVSVGTEPRVGTSLCSSVSSLSWHCSLGQSFSESVFPALLWVYLFFNWLFVVSLLVFLTLSTNKQSCVINHQYSEFGARGGGVT